MKRRRVGSRVSTQDWPSYGEWGMGRDRVGGLAICWLATLHKCVFLRQAAYLGGRLWPLDVVRQKASAPFVTVAATSPAEVWLLFRLLPSPGLAHYFRLCACALRVLRAALGMRSQRKGWGECGWWEGEGRIVSDQRAGEYGFGQFLWFQEGS